MLGVLEMKAAFRLKLENSVKTLLLSRRRAARSVLSAATPSLHSEIFVVTVREASVGPNYCNLLISLSNSFLGLMLGLSCVISLNGHVRRLIEV